MSIFKCKVCRTDFGHPNALGEHYRENPEHRGTKKSKKQAKTEPKIINQTKKSLAFCPRCGLDLDKIQAAINLIDNMKG
jgi:hypothetical protein